MKRFVLTIAAILATVASFAQDNEKILSELETLAAGNARVEARFDERRVPAPTAAEKKEVSLSGVIKYTSDGKLSMDYDNGEQFVIGTDRVVINRDGRVDVYDTTKNLMMKGLSNCLIYTFQGKLKDLSKLQNTDINIEKTAKGYTAKLKAKKKSARGYSGIEIDYDAKGRIKSMRMDEFSGATTYYSVK